MRIHNELGAVTITITPLDAEGDAFTPTTARYKVNDSISGNEMVAWTTATPSTAISVTIPATVNTIVDTSKEKEEKVVTVQFDKDLSTQFYDEYTYKIRNLKFVS